MTWSHLIVLGAVGGVASTLAARALDFAFRRVPRLWCQDCLMVMAMPGRTSPPHCARHR